MPENEVSPSVSQYATAREVFIGISPAFYQWRRALDEAGFLCGLDTVEEADKIKVVKKLEAAYQTFLRTLTRVPDEAI